MQSTCRHLRYLGIITHSFLLDAEDCAPMICVSGRTHSEKGRKGGDDHPRDCKDLSRMIIWQKLHKMQEASFASAVSLFLFLFFYPFFSPKSRCTRAFPSSMCMGLDQTVLFLVASLYNARELRSNRSCKIHNRDLCSLCRGGERPVRFMMPLNLARLSSAFVVLWRDPRGRSIELAILHLHAGYNERPGSRLSWQYPII